MRYHAPVSRLQQVADVFLLFLRIGSTAFGGPAVHIAVMRDEVVARRRWVTDAEFLDLLAATNLIPGPNSTEMALHLGLRRAGWWGFAAAGVAFIGPAFLVVLAIAVAYQRFGTLPHAQGALLGLAPVVVIVVADALRSFCAARAWTAWQLALLTSTAGAALVGVHEIAILALAGAAGLVRGGDRRDRRLAVVLASVTIGVHWLPLAATTGTAMQPLTLTSLGVFFLKVGSLLFGSGYVLFAFLRADLVDRTRWLTDRQLLDAIAVGQFTPGPLSTTATFVGYVLGGVPGALVATVAMFAPAFAFVALSHPLIPRLRSSPRFARLLDAIVVGSLGLMVAVAWRLATSALTSWPAIAIAAIAATALLARRVPPTLLLAAGALAGWVWLRPQ